MVGNYWLAGDCEIQVILTIQIVYQIFLSVKVFLPILQVWYCLNNFIYYQSICLVSLTTL